MAELPKTTEASDRLAKRLQSIGAFLTGERYNQFKGILDRAPDSDYGTATKADGRTFYERDVEYLKACAENINRLIAEEMLTDERQARAINLVVESLVTPPTA